MNRVSAEQMMQAQSGDKRVLIVEGRPDVAQLAKLALGAEQAPKKLANYKFDLLFT